MISEIGKAELFASASAETHGGVREGCSIKAVYALIHSKL